MALRNRASQTDQAETFPFWVKRWRAYLGVTQKRFAELWGVSPSMVQKIESNDYGVGQLSFDRLESLRELLELEPATFYRILSENDPSGAEPSGETLQVTQLNADLLEVGTLALPPSFLAGYAADDVRVLELSSHTFATDRLRYTLSPHSLVLFAQGVPVASSDLLVATTTLRGECCLLIFRPSRDGTPNFLRPFNLHDERALEVAHVSEVDLLGVYLGHWSSLRTP